MKTLLQINTVVNSGSTGRIAEELGQVALANGWHSYIAYGRNTKSSKSKLIKIGTNWDINFHVLLTRLFDRHGLGSRRATKKLIDQIEKIKPTIIHLHNLHGYYQNLELLFTYLIKSGIPIIWTLHDCWPMTGHCVYFDFVGCEKWQAQCYDCPQKKEYPASFGFDRSKKNYLQKKALITSLKNLTIVPVSFWLADITKKSILSKFPVQVINNGINLDIFNSISDSSIQEKYKLQGKFVLLGVASIWSKRKGLKDFIDLNKMLGSNYQIILVGLNENQIKLLPKDIIGIIRTENALELAKIYSCADIFINPTYEDNFPTTNLESLACGTPVITYRTGGSPEAINSQTGFVVEKGDVQGLIQAINSIRLDGKSSYSLACRERAEKLYNKNDRFLDYLNLYNLALNQINNV